MRPICEQCGMEIDPETCWCGDPMEQHSYDTGHSPVPMGCICGYSAPEDEADWKTTEGEIKMKIFKNSSYTKRNYECTNVIFAKAPIKPGQGTWEESTDEEFIKFVQTQGFMRLWVENEVQYYGYL